MEVHSHTHTARKKWTHYFWEFLMLFLAVTLGFLVENQREHMVEHKREKQFMKSLVEDLHEDMLILDRQISNSQAEILEMDSLIYMLSDKNEIKQTNRLYYLGRIASRHDIFDYNNRTIDQMRNSGAFRIIRNEQVTTLIMSYYRQIRLLEMLEGIEKEEEHEYRRAAIRVFDPLIFNSMVNHQDSIIMPEGNPALRTRDMTVLTDLSGWLQYMRSSVTGFKQYKIKLKKMAEELTALIRKEYHLK